MIPRVTLLVTIAAAAAALFPIACSGSDASPGLSATATLTPPEAGTTDDGGGASANTGPGGGAGTATPARPAQPQTVGSPLCNASGWMGCYPDNAKSAKPSDCNLSPDVRAYDGGDSGFDIAQSACHVQRASNDAGIQPVCTSSGAGTVGMACNQPTDCAPGYECVGEGKCQPYCCEGQCDHSNLFCDIQPIASDPALKVPVCMPIQSCALLDSDGGSCPATETCNVVRFDTGATSCVAIGPKQAGEDCNTANCARGLTCLGAPAERICYILCHTGQRSMECTTTPKQTCKGGIPLFPVPGIGICE
ncbi:MAG TPA: hypothetical protein VN894_13740 [Polyangiaceae bacterium]|nr:hypothetical protein [Polyangiaceae bacterium]